MTGAGISFGTPLSTFVDGPTNGILAQALLTESWQLEKIGPAAALQRGVRRRRVRE